MDGRGGVETGPRGNIPASSSSEGLGRAIGPGAGRLTGGATGWEKNDPTYLSTRPFTPPEGVDITLIELDTDRVGDRVTLRSRGGELSGAGVDGGTILTRGASSFRLSTFTRGVDELKPASFVE